MTSSFHCIPNSCARISYLVYELENGIRYRYPSNGNWEQLDGIYTYTIEEESGSCAHLDIRPVVNTTITFEDPVVFGSYTLDIQFFGDFDTDYVGISFSNSLATANFTGGVTNVKNFVSGFTGQDNPIVSIEVLNVEYRTRSGSKVNMDLDYVRDIYCSPDRCTFKIFDENQQEILKIIRDECPDVEVLDNSCQLSQNHRELLIEKLPYLERVDILDQVIESNYIGGAIPALTISSGAPNCLYIYKALITAPSVPINGTALPTLINPWTLVGVLCSDDSSCDPPIYTVHCDCDCQSCPEGTCAVLCGNQMCCYDSNGIAVASIPIEDYCEGNP